MSLQNDFPSRRLSVPGRCVASAAATVLLCASFAHAAPDTAAAPSQSTSSAKAALPPPVHGTGILDAIKASPSAPPASMLSNLIKPEVALLGYPVPRVQADARRRLEEGVVMLGGGTVSAAYGLAYSTILNSDLLPLLKSPDLRTRLNAAIVVERVASHVPNPDLGPAATLAANDKTEAVALWGVKAARYILPSQLAFPAAVRQLDLAKAVVRAVQVFPASGAIAEEAYDALAGPGITGTAANPTSPSVPAAAMPLVISLMQARIDQYRKVDPQTPGEDGNLIGLPPSPISDAVPGLLFLSSQGWRAAGITSAEHQQMGQIVIDLLDQLVRIVPAAPKRQPTDAPEAPRQEDLIFVIQKAGSAAQVMLDKQGSKSQAGQVVARFNVSTSPEQMAAGVMALRTAFQQAELLPGAGASTASAPK